MKINPISNIDTSADSRNKRRDKELFQKLMFESIALKSSAPDSSEDKEIEERPSAAGVSFNGGIDVYR